MIAEPAERIAERIVDAPGGPATAETPKHRLAGAASRRRRSRVDRIARGAVTAGGIAIIGSILAILIFIVAEVLPLVRPARVETARELALPGGTAEALLADEHRTHVVAAGRDGRVRAIRLTDGAVVAEQDLGGAVGPGAGGETALVRVVNPPRTELVAASTRDGRLLVLPVAWRAEYEEGKRKVRPELGTVAEFRIDPDGGPLGAFTVRSSGGADFTAVAQREDGNLVAVRRTHEENAFTGEVTESEERFEVAVEGRLQALAVDDHGRELFGARGGQVLSWRLDAGGFHAQDVVPSAGATITALNLLVGGRSLVVGRGDGRLEVWFRTPRPEGPALLAPIREFAPLGGPIATIAPSRRAKGFLALSAAGEMGLYYSTSHRVLWTGPAPVPDATAITYAPKGNGAFVAGDGRLAVLDVESPHPEVSWTSLFGRVWYEGYPEPAYVWQSSSGSDDFEPKLSLTPLLVGTLKGTLYSLLIAIPLAVFGAMYLSHFMAPSLKRVVKPTIEIMAAMPSVVLGFLAGLWLAPRVERVFPALLLLLFLFPLLTVAAGALWDAFPRRFRNRFPVGIEGLLFVAVLAAGLWIVIALSGPLERALFGGDFQSWLLTTTGFTYDQRNAIVVGIAMGFAVIPIIFAISEDAFANVPQSLVSGSLALGANRWQTVVRVVLPTASPGIFSAIMVGFGRAVGETMIVLMATGNTPIMDWSPFNGFRTLSANIAVEIPEAPQFSTLYRILFLAALLLFVLTFIVNTAAEVVRHRLRQRYGQL
jgi:phosphate transport system permease protein